MRLPGPAEKATRRPQLARQARSGLQRRLRQATDSRNDPPRSHTVSFNDSQPRGARRRKTLRNICLLTYRLDRNETHLISHKSRKKTTERYLQMINGPGREINTRRRGKSNNERLIPFPRKRRSASRLGSSTPCLRSYLLPPFNRLCRGWTEDLYISNQHAAIPESGAQGLQERVIFTPRRRWHRQGRAHWDCGVRAPRPAEPELALAESQGTCLPVSLQSTQRDYSQTSKTRGP